MTTKSEKDISEKKTEYQKKKYESKNTNYKKKAISGKEKTDNNKALVKLMEDEKDDSMIFIAASGVEQIGMNLNIFGYKGQYIVVDVGISFSSLGSGITLPSMNILYDIGPENILGFVLTHGHEDHIGALAKFVSKINKPIYATAFTMSLIEKKLKENHVRDTTRVTVEGEKEFNLGPFTIIFTYTAHSIPDSNHIIIKTPNATVFHTGDWKFDEKPVIGEKLNKNYLSQLAQKQKITALINDSTNAFEYARIGTEGDAFEGLKLNIEQYPQRKIIVSCFSSNLARIKSLATIAKSTNRKLILVGRSLINMATIAVQHKLLEEKGLIFDVRKGEEFSPEECLYVCTGSQGEINSVLQRCALDLHPHLKINGGDVLILSSRIIPGNESEIAELKNNFINKKVEIIDHNLKKDDLGIIHVSGHPGREDIKEMIGITQCKWIIPVHGDAYHLYAAEKIVEEYNKKYPKHRVKCKVPQGNGTVFKIHDDFGVEIMGKLETYTEVIDGKMQYNKNDDIFRQRGILNEQGVLVIMVNKQKKNHVLVNYGAVSKFEWDRNLKKHILKIIEESNFEPESLRNQINYEVFQRYDKNPIIILATL